MRLALSHLPWPQLNNIQHQHRGFSALNSNISRNQYAALLLAQKGVWLIVAVLLVTSTDFPIRRPLQLRTRRRTPSFTIQPPSRPSPPPHAIHNRPAPLHVRNLFSFFVYSLIPLLKHLYLGLAPINWIRSRGQMARRLATNQKIVGSIPTVTFLFAVVESCLCFVDRRNV
jgi:hypothetical protein